MKFALFNKLWIFIVCAFVAINAQGMSQTTQTGLLIPFYVIPTEAAIQPLLKAKADHPDVPIRVIVNPNSGVGTGKSHTYVRGIKALQNAGIEVLGYVFTDYNARPLNQVKNEINRWWNWYRPDGIFVDAMGSKFAYYNELKQFINAKGMPVVVGNTDQNVDVSYRQLADTIVLGSFNNQLPNVEGIYCNWQSPDIPKSSKGLLFYNISNLPEDFINQVKESFGWIYITNDNLPNPWDSLPSYFSSLVAALDEGSPTNNSGEIGIVVPFYIYPSAGLPALMRLIIAKRTHPNVPIYAILNPNSGPGAQPNLDYVAAIAVLKANGIIVLGYVHTSYDQRPISAVQSDIQKWREWYNPHGIFFDEMNANAAYYQEVVNIAKANGATYVMGNPGANIDVSVKDIMDSLVIFENGTLPNLNDYANWRAANVPRQKLVMLSYNIASLSPSAIEPLTDLFGLIYVTTDNLPNPWDILPPYFEDLVKLADQLNQKRN